MSMSTRPLAKTRAPVMEVFASIQGEGAYVGEPQSFLRLAGCPLRCAWCDTPNSWTVSELPRTRIAGVQGARHEEGWATPFQSACWIAEVEPAEPRTVSVTGGEPLLWPDYLLALRGMLGERRMHLETAGAHPDSLARVLDIFQHFSLDLKLPADMGAPQEPVVLSPEAHPATEASPCDAPTWSAARRACLELIADKDACAKLVIAGGRDARDYDPLVEDLAQVAPEVPLYLTPATPMAGVPAPDLPLVVEVAERARELNLAVRILPQVHRLLRIP